MLTPLVTFVGMDTTLYLSSDYQNESVLWSDAAWRNPSQSVLFRGSRPLQAIKETLSPHHRAGHTEATVNRTASAKPRTAATVRRVPTAAFSAHWGSSTVANDGSISLDEIANSILSAGAAPAPRIANADIPRRADPSLVVGNALFGSQSANSVQQTNGFYVADGVDLNNLAISQRFFDSGKGVFWLYGSTGTAGNDDGCKAFIAAWKANAAAHGGDVSNMDFLGDWGTIGTTRGTIRQEGITYAQQYGIDEYAVMLLSTATRYGQGQITDDGDMCWAHSAANVIQYWESYYGIFYNRDAGELPLGFAVKDRETAAALNGIQSLRVTKWLYEHFENTGATTELAFRTYLSTYSAASESGNYFSPYWSNDYSCYRDFIVRNLSSLTNAVFTLMGYTMKDGELVQNTAGQICSVSIFSDDGGGHAVTLYGFGLDSNGIVDSILLADSNGGTFGLSTYYLKEEDGGIALYEDAARTTYGADGRWMLRALDGINTPDTLKSMYQQYSTNDLTWSGTLDTWKADEGTGDSALALPTTATGWVVPVNSTTYEAYFDASRNVAFTDEGNTGDPVTISGAVVCADLTITTTEKDYTFTADTSVFDSTLTVSSLIKSGTQEATFSGLTLNSEDTDVREGTLTLDTGTTLQNTDTITVRRGGNLSVNGGTVTTGTVEIQVGGICSVSGTSDGSSNVIQANTITLDTGSELSFALTDANKMLPGLILIGESITLGQNITINIEGGSPTENQRYNLISFGQAYDSSWLSHFVCYNGTLGFDEAQTLYLTYANEKTSEWKGSSNAWSSSEWDGSAVSADGTNVVFNGGETATITVSGTVSPGRISITNGTYTWSGSGTVSGTRELTVSGGASLTAAIDIGERKVSVSDSSTFTYSSAEHSLIDDLSVAAGSHVYFGLGTSSTGTYEVSSADIKGSATLRGSVTLTLNAANDSTINFAANSANSTLKLRNASLDGDITYSGSVAAAGHYAIGDAADTFGTTLSISSFSGSLNAAIAEGSTLLLNGSGTLSGGTLQGDGTVQFAEDSSYTVTDEDAPKLSRLNVGGSLNFNSSWGLSYTSAKDMDISGSVSFTQGATLSGAVSLNGGSISSSENVTIQEVRSQGGTINANGDVINIAIQQLSGNGDIQLNLQGRQCDGLIAVKSVSELQGDVSFTAGSSYVLATATTTDTARLLELGGGAISGSISMILNDGKNVYGATTSTWHNKGHIAVNGDLTAAGLDLTLATDSSSVNAGYDAAYLDSGSCTMTGSNQSVTPNEQHTLTIATKGSSDAHSFTGHIGSRLSITKTGEGSQAINGDLSSFGGAIRITAGTLTMNRDTNVSLADATNSTAILADSFDISGGAEFQSNLALTVSGDFITRAYESGALSVGVSELVFNAAKPAVVDANLVLQGQNLILGSTIDLDGHSLRIESASTVLTLTQDSSLTDFTNGVYDVVLFSGISSETDGLYWNARSFDSPVAASTLLSGDIITDDTQIVYNPAEGTLVLHNALITPEPTTATLSLLALAGICARRKRL